MEYTPISGDVISIPQPAADRPSAFGLERILIDGNDADTVHRTAQKLPCLVRRRGAVTLIASPRRPHRQQRLPVVRRSGQHRPEAS